MFLTLSCRHNIRLSDSRDLYCTALRTQLHRTHSLVNLSNTWKCRAFMYANKQHDDRHLKRPRLVPLCDGQFTERDK